MLTVLAAATAAAQGAPPDATRVKTRTPAAPPSFARIRGWMPLGSTGVPGFLAAHPQSDGRGVLIAILDSGIDAGAAGLGTTSTNAPKILDLRDFSSEGGIVLTPAISRGDTLVQSGRRLLGFGRVKSVTTGPWFTGLFLERPLGQVPAADVNENGTNADSLLIVVGKTADGWALFADSDGDGTLANDKPVRDFLQGRETFGWHAAGASAPLTIAANFADSAGLPKLHLVFDTEAHGTHVAGIAAGRSIGDAAGFDGVAPGAQILGLKISRNDLGGLTTTGSVVAALDYAIRFAARRSMPLVVNMSFGVGNEREGAARLDGALDSILTAHPDVAFVTSAGNDGPGLSTMGFPGSSRRAITVGAFQPVGFLPPATNGLEPLLYFSSRGGELAKPDFVAPGTAYSSVPPWNIGDEFKTGTSMASPHGAGLVALLVSAALAERRAVTASDLRRALQASANQNGLPLGPDGGAGVPDLETAWRLLQEGSPPADFDVEVANRPGTTAAFTIGTPDSTVTFRITRTRGKQPVTLKLSSETAWLSAPERVRVDGSAGSITVRQNPPRLPGTYSGRVRATVEGSNTPLFWLNSTVVVPFARTAAPAGFTGRLLAGGMQRMAFAADSGRPFQVRFESGARDQTLIASLHQPGGQPVLGDNGVPAGVDTLGAVFDVDGRDALPGYYEAIATAPSDKGGTARIEVRHAPARLELAARPDSVIATLRDATDSAVAGTFRFGVLGAERRLVIDTSGSGDLRLPVEVPQWTREIIADLEFTREQWPRFTDFGFAFEDVERNILDKEPANYALTRMVHQVKEGDAGKPLELVLAPAFTDPGPGERWKARVTLRFIAPAPAILTPRENDLFRIAPGSPQSFHARLASLPWRLPRDSYPLLIFVMESGGTAWTWQLPAIP